MDYLRYLLPVSFLFITGVGALMGGIATCLGMLLFPIVAFIECFLKDDFSVRKMSKAGAVFMLYFQLIPWAFLWYALWEFLGTDYPWFAWVGAVLSTALITAAVGLLIAHELFHRLEGISRFTGNLIAVTLMAGDVELEHRMGHRIETSSIRY